MSDDSQANPDSLLRIPPRLDEVRRNRPRLVVLSAGGAILGTLLLFLFDPSRYGFYPVCNFYRTTGLLCPGCGSLRAMHHLLHGEIAEAMHFNALLVLCLPLFGIYALRQAWEKHRGNNPAWRIPRAWLWCGFVILVLFGVLRNLPFAQAAWLAP